MISGRCYVIGELEIRHVPRFSSMLLDFFQDMIIIIILLVMYHELDLHRPVSASSNSPFKVLSSRFRPFDL